MVNTNMFEFKHPKYYTELRKRNKETQPELKSSVSNSDQVISKEPATAGNQRAPGPGHKPQASSLRPEASSDKQQASSHKRLEAIK